MMRRIAWGILSIAALLLVFLALTIVAEIKETRIKVEKCEELGGTYYSEYYSKYRYKCGKIDIIKLKEL